MKTSSDIDVLLRQEFLITNGIGGYASSSIAFANTRKYHGLLISTSNPPTERNVIVHKLEERLKIDNDYYDLSVNKYGDDIYPSGYSFLKSFERQPIAKWSYGTDSWSLEKEIMMVPGSNTTIVRYTNTSKSDYELELHPLFTQRDYHSILNQNDFDFYYKYLDKQAIKIHAYPDSPATYCKWSEGEFAEDRTWYKGFHYDRSAYRGIDASEDSYRIGYTTTALRAGKSVYILFTDEEKNLAVKVNDVEKTLIDRYASTKKAAQGDVFLADLLMSGDQFVVDRKSTDSKTILAGYHWFTDWGRDTMIAMRGLTISTGKKEETESLLNTFFKYLDQGMLPNRFPDYAGQEVEYNTIDATLWLFVVMYDYYEKFGDKKFVKKYIDKLEEIIDKHIEGTRYSIKLNDLGFIEGGEDGWQLTWMDARVNNFVVTGRVGAPVEINMLWYNGLNIYAHLCKELAYKPKVDTDKYLKLFSKNFKKYFWNKDGHLNDYVEYDGSLNLDFRCNQIYAVSLPFTLLTEKEQQQVVDSVENKLYTDYGLRTLDMDNSAFKPIYAGNAWDRDTSYHQGTVWPFFIAPFFEAYLKVNGYSKNAKQEVAKRLETLKDHFYNRDCVHGISEIFDGEKPGDGRGCINQAWSVSGVIKLYFDHNLNKI